MRQPASIQRLLFAVGLTAFFLPTFVSAVDLKPETIQAWDEYVQAATERHQPGPSSSGPFLWSDTIPGQTARLQRGEIVVAPYGPHIPLKVPLGLIHDWVGAAFIPNARLSDVLHIVRDYDRYKDFYGPHVAESKPIGTTELQDRFSMQLMNKSVVAKTAFDGEFQSFYTRLDERRWYSFSESTHVQEIADYGTPNHRSLPEGTGSGIIWRLQSFTRFEERDGGVYVELEALALSRDVPGPLRWFIDPLVRRTSRSSLVTSLEQTQQAVGMELSCSTRPSCLASGTAVPKPTRSVR